MLFAPALEAEPALQAARRAVELTHEREPAYLHTLATVHAVRGEPAEALQVLRKAVERSGPGARPETHDWLVVGLVDEAYGLTDEAAEAYRRVAPGEPGDGLSSHALAQRRLKVLAARAPAARP
jgi:tetratricopeptide (TPR) repeat protein